jgi:hypothetical protein
VVEQRTLCQFVELPDYHVGRKLTVPDLCVKFRKPLAEHRQLSGGELYYFALNVLQPACE